MGGNSIPSVLFLTDRDSRPHDSTLDVHAHVLQGLSRGRRPAIRRDHARENELPELPAPRQSVGARGKEKGDQSDLDLARAPAASRRSAHRAPSGVGQQVRRLVMQQRGVHGASWPAARNIRLCR